MTLLCKLKDELAGKNWEIVQKLNPNLKARIRSKYGLTREIRIKVVIRQVEVLSVVQYATMIDDIA